jgi:hypothetical protein
LRGTATTLTQPLARTSSCGRLSPSSSSCPVLRLPPIFEIPGDVDLGAVGESDVPRGPALGAVVLADPLDLVAVVGEEPRDGVHMALGAELGTTHGNGDVRLDLVEEAAQQLWPLCAVRLVPVAGKVEQLDAAPLGFVPAL